MGVPTFHRALTMFPILARSSQRPTECAFERRSSRAISVRPPQRIILPPSTVAQAARSSSLTRTVGHRLSPAQLIAPMRANPMRTNREWRLTHEYLPEREPPRFTGTRTLVDAENEGKARRRSHKALHGHLDPASCVQADVLPEPLLRRVGRCNHSQVQKPATQSNSLGRKCRGRESNPHDAYASQDFKSDRGKGTKRNSTENIGQVERLTRTGRTQMDRLRFLRVILRSSE